MLFSIAKYFLYILKKTLAVSSSSHSIQAPSCGDCLPYFLTEQLLLLFTKNCFPFEGNVEPELLHTYSRIDPYDTLILCVRVAVLTAVTLTVPIVLFPVSQIHFVCSMRVVFLCHINKNVLSTGA